MPILIVEDEPKTAAYLHKGLTESGYQVDLAANGNDGLHLGSEGAYDLVILDVMLPDRDGWEVLSELRRRACNAGAVPHGARCGRGPGTRFGIGCR